MASFVTGTVMVKLKHIFQNDLPDQKFYFYEGDADVHYGVIELPADGQHEHWFQRAWMKGYRLDPETGRELELVEILALAHSKAESTESAQETVDEGSTGGGQPADADGVRESEQPGSEGVPARRVGSRNRNGSAGKPAAD